MALSHAAFPPQARRASYPHGRCWRRYQPVAFSLRGREVNVDNVAAGTNVAARIFSSQGTLGQVIQVNTLTGGQRFSLSAATTSSPVGDTAFLAWADDSKAGADQSGHAIKGRLLP